MRLEHTKTWSLEEHCPRPSTTSLGVGAQFVVTKHHAYCVVAARGQAPLYLLAMAPLTMALLTMALLTMALLTAAPRAMAGAARQAGRCEPRGARASLHGPLP